MKWLHKQLESIRKIDDGPQRIALGIAIGTFIGFFPPVGVKTLLAMGVTRLAKGNVIASAIAVTLHDLLLPLAPILLIWEYKIGASILGLPASAASSLETLHGSPLEWLKWSNLFRFEAPLLIGGGLVGIPFGIAGYFAARRFLGRPDAGNG